MLYLYQKLIKKLGLTDEELSNPIKKKIADIVKLEAAIAETEDKIANGNMSIKKKEGLQGKVTLSKDALPVMDADLVKAIEKWYPNRERYAQMGQRLQNSRNGKTTTTEPTSTQPASTGSQTPAPSPAPAPPTKPPKKEEQTPNEKTETKGLGFWGWAGLCLAAVALGTAGVAIAQHMQKKAA